MTAKITKKVLIVSKTHMQDFACVGGLVMGTFENVRLLQDNGYPESRYTLYDVDDIWEIEFSPCPNLEPPHIEDVLVHQAKFVRQGHDIATGLLKVAQIWQGSPELLFDGVLQFTKRGSGYVIAETGIPSRSVGFWQADKELSRVIKEQKILYEYPSTAGVFRLPYVGFTKPLDKLPTGTLLRVSLARWWKHEGANEARCYLQLSGWYVR